MGLFSTVTKSPLFLRTAGGALAGGVLFHHAAKARETTDGDVSALSTTATTLAGMVTGAAIGATFPQWKRQVATKFKSIHRGYEGVLKKTVREAGIEFDFTKAAAEKKAIKKGLLPGSKGYEEAMASFKTRPAATDFPMRAKAAAETYIKPSMIMPAGMLIGGVYAANHGQDPISGAMTGGLVAASLGIGYHGFKVYGGLKTPIRDGVGKWAAGRATRGAIGVGLVGTAFVAGVASNTPQYKEEARAVSTPEGYEAQQLDPGFFRGGAGRRSRDMGASGDLVFGLQNMRHG